MPQISIQDLSATPAKSLICDGCWPVCLKTVQIAVMASTHPWHVRVHVCMAQGSLRHVQSAARKAPPNWYQMG